MSAAATTVPASAQPIFTHNLQTQLSPEGQNFYPRVKQRDCFCIATLSKFIWRASIFFITIYLSLFNILPSQRVAHVVKAITHSLFFIRQPARAIQYPLVKKVRTFSSDRWYHLLRAASFFPSISPTFSLHLIAYSRVI
jgi:hypothetical protein